MSKENNLTKFLGIIFLFFSFYTSFKLRVGNDFKDFLFVVTICIFTDIGGYVFGRVFKGPKLTKISPKKTYAGVIGGFLLSLIAGLVFNNYLLISQKIFNENLILFILQIQKNSSSND